MSSTKKLKLLTIRYDEVNEIKSVLLDDAIARAVKEFGYTFYASGFNTITRERDLAFEYDDTAGGRVDE